MNLPHPKILPLVYLGIATIVVVLPMSKEQYWPRLSDEEQAIEYALKFHRKSMIAREPMLNPTPEQQQEDVPKIPRQPARKQPRPAPAATSSPAVQKAIAVSHFRVRDPSVKREIAQAQR